MSFCYHCQKQLWLDAVRIDGYKLICSNHLEMPQKVQTTFIKLWDWATGDGKYQFSYQRRNKWLLAYLFSSFWPPNSVFSTDCGYFRLNRVVVDCKYQCRWGLVGKVTHLWPSDATITPAHCWVEKQRPWTMISY